MQNTEKAKTYKIADDSVIHLVAKANEEMVENTTTSNTDSTTNVNANANTNNANSQQNISPSPEDMFSSLIEIPIIRPRRPRRRRSKFFRYKKLILLFTFSP